MDIADFIASGANPAGRDALLAPHQLCHWSNCSLRAKEVTSLTSESTELFEIESGVCGLQACRLPAAASLFFPYYTTDWRLQHNLKNAAPLSSEDTALYIIKEKGRAKKPPPPPLPPPHNALLMMYQTEKFKTDSAA